MVSSGRRDPPNGVALEELSICSAENFSGDGEGRALGVISHPEGTEKSLAKLTHPLESLSFAAAMRSCGGTAGGHGFRISLQIDYDRVYEPYGVQPVFVLNLAELGLEA